MHCDFQSHSRLYIERKVENRTEIRHYHKLTGGTFAGALRITNRRLERIIVGIGFWVVAAGHVSYLKIACCAAIFKITEIERWWGNIFQPAKNLSKAISFAGGVRESTRPCCSQSGPCRAKT